MVETIYNNRRIDEKCKKLTETVPYKMLLEVADSETKTIVSELSNHSFFERRVSCSNRIEVPLIRFDSIRIRIVRTSLAAMTESRGWIRPCPSPGGALIWTLCALQKITRELQTWGKTEKNSSCTVLCKRPLCEVKRLFHR